MSFNYQFSVGTMILRLEDQASPEIQVGIMTDISVSYDGDPQSFYGGDYRLPLAVELGNRSGEITCTSSRWQADDGPLSGNYIDVILGLGNTSGGISGVIQGCKVTSYSVQSTQNGFVTSDLTITIANPNHIEKGSTPPTWNSNV